MNANATVGDEYSGLANLLANLIAKYADVLDLEEEDREHKTAATLNNGHVIELKRRSPLRAPLYFVFTNARSHGVFLSRYFFHTCNLYNESDCSQNLLIQCVERNLQSLLRTLPLEFPVQSSFHFCCCSYCYCR